MCLCFKATTVSWLATVPGISSHPCNSPNTSLRGEGGFWKHRDIPTSSFHARASTSHSNGLICAANTSSSTRGTLGMLQGDISELCRLSSDWICLCADGQGKDTDLQSEQTGHSEGRAPGNGKNNGKESGRRVALITVTYGLYNRLPFASQWSKALCRCYKSQTIPFLKINPLCCMGIILLSGGAEPRDALQPA